MIPIGTEEESPQPTRSLSVLLIEDNPDDEQLCLRVLEKSRLIRHIDVVTTREEFIDRIQNVTYDIVLSDYSLGTWTGVEAFDLLREQRPGVPFILVTGALGEERAVQCVKDGMADYILKDRLERLPVAILRALAEKRLRDDQQRAVRSLEESEEKFRTLADVIPAAIFIEQENHFCYVNHAAEGITGYSRDELLAMNFSQLIHPDSKDAIQEHQVKRTGGDLSPSRYEIMLLAKQTEQVRWLDVAAGTFSLNGQFAALTTGFEVTERKRREVSSTTLRDPLTGVANRQRLVEVFDSEATRTNRTERPFSLVLIVVTGLRKIIKNYGQLVASRALCRVSRTMQLHCRSLDTVARVGEDSFAFLLPETGTDGALILGRRITTRVANDAEDPVLLCDFGVATFPQDGKKFDELFDKLNRQVRALSTIGNEKHRHP